MSAKLRQSVNGKPYRIRRNGSFGAYYEIPLPDKCDYVILCRNDDTGHKPFRLCLAHQVYVKDYKDVPGLTIIPCRADEQVILNRIWSKP